MVPKRRSVASIGGISTLQRGLNQVEPSDELMACFLDALDEICMREFFKKNYSVR
jgi:hypothetical protein